LPKSIRKFSFSWSGEPSFSDIGRYKAVLTLAYGEEGKKFVTQVLYFYVIPVKVGLIVFSVLALFVLFIRFAIKAYVRRMLLLAGIDTSLTDKNRENARNFVRDGDVKIVKRASLRGPVESGVADLRSRLVGANKLGKKFAALVMFVRSYRVFFASCLAIIVMIIAVVLFVLQASTAQRDYTVQIDNGDTKTSLSSEEILYAEKEKNSDSSTPQERKVQPYTIVLVNSSDTVGAGAALQHQLEQAGFTIDHLQSDFGKSKESSVIVYDVLLLEEAQTLSQKLGGALISARQNSASSAPELTVYIGNDYSSH
jgi:hypothetical protein